MVSYLSPLHLMMMPNGLLEWTPFEEWITWLLSLRNCTGFEPQDLLSVVVVPFGSCFSDPLLYDGFKAERNALEQSNMGTSKSSSFILLHVPNAYPLKPENCITDISFQSSHSVAWFSKSQTSHSIHLHHQQCSEFRHIKSTFCITITKYKHNTSRNWNLHVLW